MFHFRLSDKIKPKSWLWCVIAVATFIVCSYYVLLLPKKNYEQMSGEFIQPNRSTEPLLFRKNILFLKTHKTASSTVQNIIMRVGLRHCLNFLLPTFLNYIGYLAPITNDDLDEATVPLDRKFNLLVHHTRYNAVINVYLYNDTTRVTILREPAEQFESVYHFYRLDTLYQMSFEQFLYSLPVTNIADARKTRNLTGYNQMSFDLGLEPNAFDNETAIRDFIDYIDQEFHLVMIREYMDASLVLFANLMGWPLHYVSSVPLMVREQFSKYNFTTTERMKIAKLCNVDTLLYNHFIEKFRVHVLQYGVSRLIENVQKLQAMNEDLANRCILGRDYSGYRFTRGYQLKNFSDWECVYSTKLELSFTDELRYRQINRLESIKKIHELVNKTDQS